MFDKKTSLFIGIVGERKILKIFQLGTPGISISLTIYILIHLNFTCHIV